MSVGHEESRGSCAGSLAPQKPHELAPRVAESPTRCTRPHTGEAKGQVGGPTFVCFNHPHRRRPSPPAAGPAPHALAAQAHLRPEATADHVWVGGWCGAGSQRLCPRPASRDKADHASLGSEHRAAGASPTAVTATALPAASPPARILKKNRRAAQRQC